MSKSRKRRQLARKLSRARSLHANSARSLRYESLEDRRMLAVVTVTTEQDLVDFSDGVTSLREALFATNLVEGADEIRFDFGHDGPATILLTEGELAITDSLTITGNGAELLTIDASGNDPTPDVNNGDGSRIFNIDDGDLSTVIATIDVSISGVTLTGGDLGGGPISGQGGAIFSLENLNLFDVTVTANSANHDGGGIFTKGVTTITDSTFSLNQSASFSGGGLFAQDTTLVITGSTFRENTSFRDGGGLFALDTTSTITRSTFSGNTAEKLNGGGLWVKGEVLIADSTVSGNSATRGGGIFALQADPTILSSTISGNTSLRSGGGISASLNSGVIKVSHSTISSNIADSRSSGRGQGGGLFLENGFVILNHSLVTGNHDGLGSPDVAGYFSSNYSLIGIGAEFLGPLADNGGPTFTHALLPSSPAINAGDLNAVAGVDGIPLSDQRDDGFDRLFSRIDIGAYEVQELGDLNLLVDTLVDESDGDFSRGDLSLREAIELANANPVPDTIRFDPIFAAIAGPLPATILLTQGELAITDSVEIVGLGAELLTIDASGNDPTPDINNGDGSRIFNIDDNTKAKIEVSLSGLALTGGAIRSKGGREGRGGAIRSTETLAIFDSNIFENAARYGGGIFSIGNLTLDNTVVAENYSTFSGGGIEARLLDHLGASSTVPRIKITNSTIRDNVSSSTINAGGGGIYLINSGGIALIQNSVISGNQLFAGSGVGIHAKTQLGGTTTILNSTISDNVGLGYTQGAGLSLTSSFEGSTRNRESTTLVRNTTISRNTATGAGGGLLVYDPGPNNKIVIDSSAIFANVAGAWGGGINATGSGNLDIVNTTISHNTAAGAGGVSAGKRFFTIRHSSITGNVATNESDAAGGLQNFRSVSLDHTIVAGNIDNTGDASDIAGIINSNFSLIGFGAEFLGPLADNGGPTFAHALLPGSPAIDAGDPLVDGVPQFDQRGNPFTRISGGRIDIGAYESQPIPGDFDSDGDTDSDDLNFWESDYGSTGSGLNPTDSDADGDTDGTDFLNWQRTFSVVLSEVVSASVVVEKSSAADIRTEAVDLAFVVDPLFLTQSDDQQSTLETELAIDFVLLPVPETARPVHRGTVRSAYRLVESAASDKDLHAEVDYELSALDELFAQL